MKKRKRKKLIKFILNAETYKNKITFTEKLLF